MTDKLHCLTHSTNLQTKIWKVDGTVKFPPKSKNFNCKIREVNNIHELSELLTELETQNKSCLVRGCYVGDEKAAKIDTEYQEGKVRRTKSLFDDQALHSLMVEVDKFEPFDGDAVTDPQPCIKE
jgi:putative DNA primase/helicase